MIHECPHKQEMGRGKRTWRRFVYYHDHRNKADHNQSVMFCGCSHISQGRYYSESLLHVVLQPLSKELAINLHIQKDCALHLPPVKFGESTSKTVGDVDRMLSP
jgi:hypothetical protein